MRSLHSGTKVVLLFGAFAAAVFAVFRFYGGRAMSDRPADTPFQAVYEFVQADNTVVGLVGGIREVRPLTVQGVNAPGRRPAGASAHAPAESAVSAAVVGARDSGRLYADLEATGGGRWTVIRAAFVLSGGRRLPLAGNQPPRLETGASVRY